MDFTFLNNFTEVANNVGKWLFESIPGVAVLVAGCLLVTLVLAVILEFKTKNKFKNHEVKEEPEDDE